MADLLDTARRAIRQHQPTDAKTPEHSALDLVDDVLGPVSGHNLTVGERGPAPRTFETVVAVPHLRGWQLPRHRQPVGPDGPTPTAQSGWSACRIFRIPAECEG